MHLIFIFIFKILKKNIVYNIQKRKIGVIKKNTSIVAHYLKQLKMFKFYVIGPKYFNYRCGFKDSCIAHLYQTANEPGCRTMPTAGISCYTCCAAKYVTHPLYCVNNPDVNYSGFQITTNTRMERIKSKYSN